MAWPRPARRATGTWQSSPLREVDVLERFARILTRVHRQPQHAYSGATVPASHRLPAQNVESPLVQIRAASLFIALLGGACAPHFGAGASGGIVTLVPSFADDVYAVGAGRQLVAVSAFTDDPRAAALPRVADSASVDAEEIVGLRPNLVIGIPSQARLVEPLRRAHLRVVLLSDDGYDRGTRRPPGRSRRARGALGARDRKTPRSHVPVRMASSRLHRAG